jgi:hypothetical protein
MKKVGRVLKIMFWFVTAFALLLSGTAATYAWFSSNRVVRSEGVSGRSGSDSVTLQISSYGGDSFSPQDEADIVQVNSTEITRLLPVSTSDLQTFLYNGSTVDDVASSFTVVEDERYYYHGRVYLRAVAEGDVSASRMALYLDEGSETGDAIIRSASQELLNASRLGLTFDGGDGVIFRLSDESNSSENQIHNTYVNGTLLGDHQVLGYDGGNVLAVTDPGVLLSTYTITMEEQRIVLPEEPLFYMEMNRIYAVDIYFYLEGCDPDCSDSVSFNEADLRLAFYGVCVE